MALTDTQRFDAATRMVRAVTGSEYGDGAIVTDVGMGYAGHYGPSYGSGMSEVWVLGNWNDVDRYDAATGTRVVTSTVPSRLFDALERIGVNGEWLDEWECCADCTKLVRTQPDSYAWTPDYVILESTGDLVCSDCLRDCADTILHDEYVGHVDRAVTWLSVDELHSMGWHDAMEKNEKNGAHEKNEYHEDDVSGFHPGQNGTPQKTLAAWREQRAADDRDSENTEPPWLFVITDKGQFDIHWRLMVLAPTEIELTA